MELTNLQQNKVDELKSLFIPSKKVRVDFKAPTGSGKTLMSTAFISGLIEQYPNEKLVFVIATPSASSLPLFFEQKINQYKSALGFSNFTVEYVKSPSEAKSDKSEFIPKVLPEQNKVFIFGKSSFGKGRILSTFHIIDDFVQVIHEQDYSLIYIRDEAHIGDKFASDEESKNFERLMQETAFYVLKMTATPNYKDTSVQRVILGEDELNNPAKNEGKYLLKTKPVTLLNGTMTDEDMLANAIAEFKKIKQEYKKLESKDVNIRPALLVQVDNDSPTDKEKSRLFFETLERIKKELTRNDISWVQYFGDSEKDSDRAAYKNNFSLAEITDKDSDIDAVIFKIGPATGWDIPRACMLLQLRNVCSVGFNLQTIGRIKRNCYPNLEKNKITDNYYIYSNAPVEKNVFVFKAEVKDQFASEDFMSIEITNAKYCSQKVAEERLKKDICDYLARNKDKFIQDIKNIIAIESGTVFYKKTLKATANGAHISKFKNVYTFIKEILRQIMANQAVFDNCENFFYRFWKDYLKDETLYGNIPLIKEFFYLILVNNHVENIYNLINKNRQYKPKYEVKLLPYIPKEYVELSSSESSIICI